MKEGPYGIPKSWVWVTMGEISSVVGGGTPKTNDPSNYEGGTIAWLTPADLSGFNGKYVSHGERFITEKGLKTSSARIMPSGTVLFTSRAPIGYVAIAKNPICTNQGFKSFMLREGILPEYVYWYLKGSKELAESFASGTTFLELSGTKAKQLPIPIAPLDVQKRIVAEIEKQFSRLDEAVANLKRIKGNLKRYKAAVLKAAVEGKLTEQWRKEHADGESAEKLLQRILAERRTKWERTELAIKSANRDKLKGKHQEPEAPDVENLPDIPSGWVWVRLDTVTDIKGGITKDSKRKIGNPRMLPYLRVANVQRGYLDLKEIKYIEVPVDQIDDLLLEEGDILFNEGGDRDKLGRGWIWEGQIKECTYQNHVFRARPYLKALKGRLISWYGNTFGQQFFMAGGKQTTNLASVNKTMLSSFPIPLPPLSEQAAIVMEVEQRLTISNEMEKDSEANLRRAERLRQSILKRAFSGEL